VKPVVVFDIDGTWADYHGGFHEFCHRYFTDLPRPAPHMGIFDCIMGECFWDGVGEFENHIGITKAQYREAKLAYRLGGNKRSLRAFADMTDLVQRLQAAGCEVWVATTRPWSSLSNIDPDTQEWLRRQRVTVDGLLYGDTKYAQLCEAIDKERIIACVEDLGLPVIQIKRNHNRHSSCERVPRGNIQLVHDWVFDRLDQWNKDHKS
jgi:hypothetical protein